MISKKVPEKSNVLYQLTLYHTTIGGLGSGISVRKEVSFQGSLESAKKEATRLLKRAKESAKIGDWEKLNDSYFQLDTSQDGGFSVGIRKENL